METFQNPHRDLKLAFGVTLSEFSDEPCHTKN